MNPFASATLPVRIIASAVALAVVLLAAWWLLSSNARHKREAAEARAGQAMSEARTESGAQAGVILDRAHERAAASEQLSRETADAIQAAPGADVRLDPGLNRAALERVCKRASAAGLPECMQYADRAKPAR